METDATPVGRWMPIGLSGGGGTEASAISPHDPDFLIVNSDMSGVFRSFDGGRSWRIIPYQQLQACPFCRPAFHPRNPDIIFAADSYLGRLKVSRDRGATWSPLSPEAPNHLRVIAVDPLDPDRMLLGTRDGAWMSDDGGGTWRRCAGVDGTVIAVYFSRAGGARGRRPLVVATVRGINVSDDFGQTWPAVGANELPALPLVSFAASSANRAGDATLYAWLGRSAEDDRDFPGSIWVSFDFGDLWLKACDLPTQPDEPTSAAPPLGYLLASDAARDTVYVVKKRYSRDDTVLRSDDAGDTRRPLAFADKTDPRYNLADNYITNMFLPRSLWSWTITHAAIDPNDADHVWFANYCSGFVTTDGGKRWHSQETRPASTSPAEGLRRTWVNNGLNITTTWNYYVDPRDADHHFIAYTDLGLAESEDGGATWMFRRDTGPNTYQMLWDPDVAGRVWAAFSLVHDIPNNNSRFRLSCG